MPPPTTEHRRERLSVGGNASNSPRGDEEVYAAHCLVLWRQSRDLCDADQTVVCLTLAFDQTLSLYSMRANRATR